MKKLAQFVSASVVGVTMMAGVAAADPSSCNISNTGQSSTNTCTVTGTENLTVTCNNNVDVIFVNGQSTTSGSVNLTQNTSGGYAVSGSATNVNTVNGQLDVSCGQVAVAPAPAPTPAPVVAAGGAGAASTPAPAAAPKAASLPKTGSNAMLNTAVVAVSTVGASLVAVQLGIMAYRRLALK